ncbi:hypothetical protein JCM10450v2_004507 [Rhodotorula kratochvilovae]
MRVLRSLVPPRLTLARKLVVMAATDSTGVLLLRGVVCLLGGLTAGLLLAVPALAVPALFASPHLSPKARLHVWSRLQADTAALAGRLVPLLAAALACCALLVQSAPTAPSSTDAGFLGWLAPLPALVAQNRRTLFTIAASLLTALRPYSFGLLTPRIEALKAEERRLLLRRARSASLSSLGGGGWRGASPTKEYGEWVEQREREAEESDVEDNEEEGDGDGAGAKAVPLDTDALILELTRLQYGTAVLAGASFALTVLELVCA